MDVLITLPAQYVGMSIHKSRGQELVVGTAFRPVCESARAKSLTSTSTLWIKSLTSDANGITCFHLLYEALVPMSQNLCIVAQIAWLNYSRRETGLEKHSLPLPGFAVYLL